MPISDLNFSLNDYNIITETDDDGNPIVSPSETFGSNINDYLRLSVYGRFNQPVRTNTTNGIFYAALNTAPFSVQIPGLTTEPDKELPNTNDFIIYTAADTNRFLKINEILNFFEVPEGNYTAQLDFLRQYKPTFINSEIDDRFIVKQISPSRLEVRLKLLNNTIDEINQLDLSSWNNENGEYAFKHVLHIGNGRNIPIVNYTIDSTTQGESNQSLILKLYEPLPSTVSTLETVTVEKEILVTQTEQIVYFSDVPPSVEVGSLNIHNEFDYVNFSSNDSIFQNLDDISGSLLNERLKSISSGSEFDFPNLNINFNEFENHTFFGSAKRKLENFKNKVETLQNFYGNISSSLSGSVGITSASDDPSLVQTRLRLFDKIENEKLSFTPYERFLYYDGQSQTTASAPGLGKNYADNFALRDDLNTSSPVNKPKFFKSKDGFENVYVVTASNLNQSDRNTRLFRNKYRAEQKPFYGYSGSVYMSFLVKGDQSWGEEAGSSPTKKIAHSSSETTFNGVKQSPKTLGRKFISRPEITGSIYRRYIIEVSSSYYAPTEHAPIPHDVASIDDFTADSNQFEVLSGSIKTGSHEITVDGAYQSLATFVTGSNEDESADVTFSGSIIPHNDLFDLHLGQTTTAAISSSTFTDIRVSLNNPTDVYPFDNLYHTSSANWTNWYNGMYDSASAFDEINIHSLENNLPLYIKQSDEYEDLKTFLSLIGEKFDLIRNHIDNLGSVHNRDYSKLESVPTNLLPILLDNLGFDTSSPFLETLSGYFGNSLSSVTSVKDIEENTWRKILNNLVYLYKSKGTQNAVRGLVSIVGYPSDVLSINEFGGSTLPQNDSPISPLTPTIGTTNNDTNLSQTQDNVSFTRNQSTLYHYRLSSRSGNRELNLPWYVNDANIDTFEFVYKHKDSENVQDILISTGSESIPSTGSIFISSSTATVFDGHTLGITSSDGTIKTYIFDDDGDGATGTTDGSGRVRIQINGLSDASSIAGEVSKSILSSNGHNGKIKVDTFERFVNSDGDVVTDSDGKIIFVESPTGSYLELKQLVDGDAGNTTIVTSSNNSPLTHSIEDFSGGKDGHSLWDLRLVSSADTISSSFQFRLNNSEHGSLPIASNAVSMSTDFLRVSRGALWNVMIQRMSSSISGSGTNEYRLVAGLQKRQIISQLAYVTMSVSGGITEDSNFYANQNWASTGSVINPSTGSNLIVGKTMSGSIAEIRGWSTPLSMSKFRLHTLDKMSTVGNDLRSSTEELVYHFKLNENYTTSSISSSTQFIDIIDSNPNGPIDNPTNYTFVKSGSLATGSLLYGFDSISRYKMGIQSVNLDIRNNNKIITKPRRKMISNLNPFEPSTISLFVENSRAKRVGSVKLEMNRSPQDFINNFIIEKVQGFNLETLYGNPTDYYSSSYGELDSFRNKFFKDYEISVDANAFIRAHENVYNKSLVDGIKKLVPARSTLSDEKTGVGVTIKSSILDKQKVKYQVATVETNPDHASGSIEITSNVGYKSGFNIVQTNELPSSASISIDEVIVKDGSVDLPLSSSISIEKVVVETASHDVPLSSSISIPDNITKEITNELPQSSSMSIPDEYISQELTIENPKSSSISLENVISESFSIFTPKSGSVSMMDVIAKSGEIFKSKSGSISIPNNITKEMTNELPKSSSMSIVDDYISKQFSVESPQSASLSIPPTSTSELTHPVSGTENYISNKGYETFVDLHKLWGTSSSDVHFLNMAATEDSGSAGDYNVLNVERRYFFISIGDVEVYSGSTGNYSDFSNPTRFYNRLQVDDFINGNITYNSYINSNPGSQKGRAMGKTRYFFTGSDGAIILPSNHVRQFSNPWVDRMYNGTQNTNPGFQPHNTYVDLSSASFYAVTITGGENQLIVKSGDSSLDGDDKIIY